MELYNWSFNNKVLFSRPKQINGLQKICARNGRGDDVYEWAIPTFSPTIHNNGALF